MNCLECDDHEIIPDPDPNDWFCDDDRAVVCKLLPNKNQNTQSKYASDYNPYRIVAKSCRPHHLEEECKTPKWCPKNKIESKGTDKNTD